MSFNIEKLREIVSSANFSALIGEVENEWFDCKNQPYQLQNDGGKRELAKDVSAFANNSGGFIFMGVKTKESAEHFGDEIESVNPFAPQLVDPSQYKNVINAWVYPQIEGLEVKWIEIPSEPGKGICVISIPQQNDAVKPFLITKTLDGKKQVETFFGFAQRKGDGNQPLSVIDLQKSLRSGLHYESQVKERLDGMEALLKESVHKNQDEIQKKSNGERIEQRIARALEYENLKDGRNVSITAFPGQSSQLKTIFLSSEGSIRKLLENPPILRRAGWNLRTLDQARIMRGEMIRVGNGKRLVIDLYRDGTLVFAAQGDQRFLAWHDEQGRKINSVALIEIIYEFFNFYQRVVADFEQPPESFTVRFDLKNLHLDGVKTGLAPYGANSFSRVFDPDIQDASEEEATIEKEFRTENYDAKIFAYELVQEIYLWFGIEQDKIPYVKEEDGIKFIDTDAIKGI